MTCTHICNEEHTDESALLDAHIPQIKHGKVLSWMPFLQVGAPLHTAGNLSISSPLPLKHAQSVTGRSDQCIKHTIWDFVLSF